VGTNGRPGDAEVIAASLMDPSRFGLIVDAYASPISRYLAKRVGPVLAQDLTSETFLQAFRGRRTYRADQPSALPWLYGIATNQVRAHVRSEQRRLEVLGQLGGRHREVEALPCPPRAPSLPHRAGASSGRRRGT
jgi:DNA-directed RNA polymerase specialized sigma24 family protein